MTSTYYNNGTPGVWPNPADASAVDVTATGSVTARTMADRAADVIRVADFGADPTGATDASTAIRAAITAASSANVVQPIHLQRGATYKIGSTLLFSELSGRTAGGFIGNGATFVWSGDAVSPLIMLSNVRDCRFRDFNIECTTGAPLMAGVQSERAPAAVVAPTGNRWDNITMNGGNGGLDKGWRFALGSGGDYNNDENTFHNCMVQNYVTAAWSIEHAQSRGHRMFGCGFGGNTTGRRGVRSNPNGGFLWFGGEGGGNSVADFDLTDVISPCLIEGFTSENSARLLNAPSTSSVTFLLTLQNCRFAVTSSVAADGKVVNFGFPGLTMINNRFEDGSVIGKAVQVYWNPGGGVGTFTAIGNFFSGTLAQPFTGVVPTTMIGNMVDLAGTGSGIPMTLMSADRGNADYTPGSRNYPVQRWATALTANRTFTPPTYGPAGGDRIRIIREASATGAFSLFVGAAGALKTLATAGTWCDIEYDAAAAAWRLTASGTL